MTNTRAIPRHEPTTPNAVSPQRKAAPRVSVAAYPTLPEAQRALRILLDKGMDATTISIHGTSFAALKGAKQRFWKRPFSRGAFAALLAGAAVGILFGLLSLFNVVTGILYTVLSEMIIGGITGLIGFFVARARGGFVADAAPGRFEIMVLAELATKAEATLLKR